MDIDGSSSVPPRVEVASFFSTAKEFRAEHAGFLEDGFEASKLEMAAGARVSTLAEARPPWRKKQSLVTVRRSEWRPLCLFPHEDTNYSDFGGRKLTVKTQKKSHACNFTWPKTPLVAFVFTCFHSVCACFWLKRNRCTCCYPKNYIKLSLGNCAGYL